MRKLLPLALLMSLALVPAPASAASGNDCAYELQPVSRDGARLLAEPVLIGCFATYAEALAAGSDGAISVAADATPLTLSDADIGISSLVLIGTEWDYLNYSGVSNSYYATSTCSASTTWEVAYVTDAWNDLFSSGKGFGSCDHNRKFQHSNFGGASVLCTPNCSTYGSLTNEVSSLRWSD